MENDMSVLVGRKAPDFTVPAVLGNGEIVDQYNLHENIKGKYGLIFFYPLDFTFVCPSELIALDHRMDEFKSRGVEVISVSIDSQFTHNAYRNTSTKEGGIGPVSYTMAADVTHSICQSYGVEHPVAGVAFRGAFVIDKNGDVRSQIVNDLPIGRNVDELLRIIDAVQFFEENGEVCPAGWQKGQPGMKASPKGVADYLSDHSDNL
jgi:peroxiredoxin 2/4